MIPKSPPVTIALVALSLAVYLLMNIGLRADVLSALLISAYHRPVLPEILDGHQWWRLFTPVFLHFSIFHLVFNLLWTWEFGRLIERRNGPGMLVCLTVLVGVLSNLVQFLDAGPLFGGLSGVIYGYFGYLWIRGRFSRRFAVSLNPAVVKLMLGWFVVCWSGILGLFGISVANSAHTAGLAAGAAVAAVMCVHERLTA